VVLEKTVPDAVTAGSSGPAGLAIRWVFPSSDGSITPLESGASWRNSNAMSTSGRMNG